MDDVVGSQVLEAGGKLSDEETGAGLLQRGGGGDVAAEVAAGTELHEEEQVVGCLLDVDQGDDVGVLKLLHQVHFERHRRPQLFVELLLSDPLPWSGNANRSNGVASQ